MDGSQVQKIGFGLQLGLGMIAVLGGEWALFVALGRLSGPMAAAVIALNIVIVGGIILLGGMIGFLQTRIQQMNQQYNEYVSGK